ncbi:hypothetical protein ACJW30_01G273000 [Castanea mollissima]
MTLLCFRIAPCDTYYPVFETMKSAIWRSSSSVSVCIINKLMPFPTATGAARGGTWGLVLLDSPEVKNFNKIMTMFGLAWTHGLHHGVVIIWSRQSASLYGREYHNKAQEKD